MNAYYPILTTDGFKSLTGYEGYEILKVGDFAITFDNEITTQTTLTLQMESLSTMQDVQALNKNSMN